MNRSVYVLNGPNLNLLGVREPHLYGTTTLADVEKRCREVAAELEVGCEFRQSNHEGILVDWIQEARANGAAVVINPAGLSFRSIPLIDALKTLDHPVMEIHVTNIHRREAIYQTSLVSSVATGVICGLGPYGYEVALRAAVRLMGQAKR